MVVNPLNVSNPEYKTCNYCEGKIYPTEKYCNGCKVYISLGTTVKRKNKELSVKTLLDQHEIKFTHDLTIKDGCSKKRPDFIIHTNWGVIILEIDEFQHKRTTYTCECEVTRMKQLYFDCGLENMLFIRYNPDSYKPLTGRQESIRNREEYLVKFLSNNIEKMGNFKHLGSIYLFYDGFEKTAVEIEKIDPYVI